MSAPVRRPSRVRRPPRAVRFAAAAAFALAAAGPAAPAAVAQGRPTSKVESVTTPDGWTLKVQVSLPGGANEETPAVVLIHGAQESRKNWESLAAFLTGRGYAVIAPDLRKHGESTRGGQSGDGRITPADRRAMVGLDLEAVKTLLLDLHERKKLNVRKLGVVAADEGAPAALLFTYADWRKMPLPDAPDPQFRTPTGQDVRAVVLMSPEDNVPGLNGASVARDLSDDAADIAFLLVVGGADAKDSGTTERLFNRLGGRQKDRVSLVPLEGVPLRGTTLLRDPVGKGVMNGIASFLDKFVKERPAEWRSRKGRL